MFVLVADDVTILVNAESLAAFVPVAPGHARAVGFRIRVDEEVLHPLIAGARERIAKPGDAVVQIRRTSRCRCNRNRAAKMMKQPNGLVEFGAKA